MDGAMKKIYVNEEVKWVRILHSNFGYSLAATLIHRTKYKPFRGKRYTLKKNIPIEIPIKNLSTLKYIDYPNGLYMMRNNLFIITCGGIFLK